MARTHSIRSLLFAGAILTGVGSGCASGSIRIDASTNAKAQETWDRMIAEAHGVKKQQLVGAMLQLNFNGVNSAIEIASSPALQHPSILRIKDKVAGMTADEIIDLAKHTSTVKIETAIQ